MSYSYTPSGICSRKINFDVDDENKVHAVSFAGGCSGNHQAWMPRRSSTSSRASSAASRGRPAPISLPRPCVHISSSTQRFHRRRLCGRGCDTHPWKRLPCGAVFRERQHASLSTKILMEDVYSTRSFMNVHCDRSGESGESGI